MNKKIFGFILIMSLILLAGCGKNNDTTNTIPTSNADSTPRLSSEGVKEFDMTAKQWEFSPSTITINKGDRVKLNIKSIDVTHGIAISAFGINSRLNPGQTTVIDFVADKTGTFPYICSVQCGAGHFGMRGKLIVK